MDWKPNMKYKVEVIETRVYDVEYVIEATSEAEARAKAFQGETVSEKELQCREVIDRDVWRIQNEV